MKKKATKKVYNLVIVDESGSMSVIQRETLAGINETISTCQEMQKVHPEMEQYITLISFDSRHFKTHYDNVRADKARMLDKDLEFSEDAEATEAMFERERACRRRFGDYCYADLPMEEGSYFD